MRVVYNINTTMTRKIDEVEIKSFTEVGSKTSSYSVYNNIYPGSEVIVRPKGPGHISHHPLESHPVVFHNIGYVIAHPDRHGPTTSKTKATKEKQQIGEVVLYEKDNFFELIDLPGAKDSYPEHTATVVVLYKYDGSENPTMTYYFDKKIV